MKVPPARLFTSEDYYKFTWEGWPIQVELERFDEDGDRLAAEICIRNNGSYVTRDKLNLIARRSRETLAKSLVRPSLAAEKKAEELETWLEVLEQVCEKAVSHWREGDAPTDVMQIMPKGAREWVLEPFLEKGHNCVVFGHGGTRKSTLALGMAVSVASGRVLVGIPHVPPCAVLYCDWESDEDSLHERVAAILRGHKISLEQPIYHQRMALSLSQIASQLRKKVEKYEIGLLIYDSLGAAKAGEIQTNEASMTVFRAARSLNKPWIGIDHMSWSAVESDREPRPFGGVYTWNLGRSFWHVTGSEEDAAETAVMLSNVKANHMRKRRPLAYKLQYEGTEDWLESLHFAPCDPADVPGLEKHLSLGEQIILSLKRGPATEEEIAEVLGKSRAMVHKTLYAMRDGNDPKVIKLPQQKWGAVAQER